MSLRSRKNPHRPETCFAFSKFESLELRTLLSTVTFIGNTFPVGGVRADGTVVADFNGDGKPDVALAYNSYAGSVGVIINQGNNSFGVAQNYATGPNPVAPIIADINGDGRPDILVADSGNAYGIAGEVTILLNNGDGTFSTENINTGYGPTVHVAVGDLNRDGVPDLAVTNSNGTTEILLGNAGGTFKPGVNIGTVGTVWDIVDVNSDGNPDLITLNSVAGTNQSTVGILNGFGDGTFQPEVTYAVGAGAVSLAVGDLNNDGFPDIVTANTSASTVSVLLNGGAGLFYSRGDVAVGSSPSSVVIADVSGDGILDIATTNEGDNTASVLVGFGDGSFQAEQTYVVSNFPVAIASADFNGDGLQDLLSVNAGGGKYSLTELVNTTPQVNFVRFSNHSLFVTGTVNNDTLTLTNTGNQVVVSLNGVSSQPYPILGLKTINVQAFAGNDSIHIDGGINNAVVFAGSGNDTVTTDAGLGTIYGQTGADSLFVGGSDNVVIGGRGPDSISAAGGTADTLVGGKGRDLIQAINGSDSATGGDGSDTLVGNTGAGDTGSNTLSGGLGNDLITTGPNDFGVGGGGADTITDGGLAPAFATSGADLLD